MQVVHQHCAGLDVHKKTVVACVITPKEKGRWEKEIRTFSTMTKDLLNLALRFVLCNGGVSKGWNLYIERHLAIFVNCF
jgi:hypothetical protein